MSANSTGYVKTTSYIRPASFNFSKVLAALDKNGNGKIDVQRDVELIDTNHDRQADIAIPLGAKHAGRFVRFETRGIDEIGDYLRGVAGLNFITSFDEARVIAQIGKDLGVFLTPPDLSPLRTRYDTKSSYILVDSLTALIEKKLTAYGSGFIAAPTLTVK